MSQDPVSQKASWVFNVFNQISLNANVEIVNSLAPGSIRKYLSDASVAEGLLFSFDESSSGIGHSLALWPLVLMSLTFEPIAGAVEAEPL